MDQAERWLTCEEVAERWQMVPKTVARLVRVGDLKGIKLGRRWRFRPEDVADYESRQEVSA